MYPSILSSFIIFFLSSPSAREGNPAISPHRQEVRDASLEPTGHLAYRDKARWLLSCFPACCIYFVPLSFYGSINIPIHSFKQPFKKLPIFIFESFVNFMCSISIRTSCVFFTIPFLLGFLPSGDPVGYPESRGNHDSPQAQGR